MPAVDTCRSSQSNRVWFSLEALRVPVLAVLLAALLASNHLTAFGMLLGPLERRFDGSTDAFPAVKGIVVLGGSNERLREAARLANAHPGWRLFVSGAGEPAEIRAAMGNEVSGDRIEFENVSKTTYQNALMSRAAIMPKPGDKWLLVTSASHLPRAIGAFRQLGFAVEPWPVREANVHPAQQAAIVRHEVLGLLWYWLAGRSSELFPSPNRG